MEAEEEQGEQGEQEEARQSQDRTLGLPVETEVLGSRAESQCLGRSPWSLSTKQKGVEGKRERV